MPQAKLTHTLGDNINQSLLIRDNLCCFLKKLSRHMAQGTNRAECLGRELKDTRHATCKRGGNELRCEHDKMSVDFPNEAARCQRFLSGQAQSNFREAGTLRQRDITAVPPGCVAGFVCGVLRPNAFTKWWTTPSGDETLNPSDSKTGCGSAW
jgi:hypothetical protein